MAEDDRAETGSGPLDGDAPAPSSSSAAAPGEASEFAPPPSYLPPYPPGRAQDPGWPRAQPGTWAGFGPYPPAVWTQPAYGPERYAPPGPVPGVQWGGIGVRFGALLIDAVILLCSLVAVGLLLSAYGSPGSTGRSDTPAETVISLVWWLFALIYHPAFWYAFGATPGQKVLGLRVAQASNGRALGLGAVVTRYLIFFTITVVTPLAVISAAMAASDPFKRAWHDHVARSVVVRE